jgi:hypothetical protein
MLNRPRIPRVQTPLRHALLAPLLLQGLLFGVTANAAQWPEPLPTVPHYELPSPLPDAATLKPPHYTFRQTPSDTYNQQERQGETFRQWLVAFYQKTINDPVALFTLVLSISTFFLWLVTRKSANAARDAAEVLPATERPYVLIVGGSGRPDFPNTAEDTHGLLLTRILKGGEEISPLWVVCPDDWITGDVTVMRGENMLMVRQPTRMEGEELFLRIIVNYRGVFTKGHETSVCWRFSFDEHMFLQYGGNEYNYER